MHGPESRAASRRKGGDYEAHCGHARTSKGKARRRGWGRTAHDAWFPSTFVFARDGGTGSRVGRHSQPPCRRERGGDGVVAVLALPSVDRWRRRRYCCRHLKLVSCARPVTGYGAAVAHLPRRRVVGRRISPCHARRDTGRQASPAAAPSPYWLPWSFGVAQQPETAVTLVLTASRLPSTVRPGQEYSVKHTGQASSMLVSAVSACGARRVNGARSSRVLSGAGCEDRC